MKKLVFLLIVLVISSSALSVIAIPNEVKPDQVVLTEKMTLSDPVFLSQDPYLSVHLPQATSKHRVTGEPMVPKITKVFVLPFLSTVTDVSVAFEDVKTTKISNDIQPAAPPCIDGIRTEVKAKKNAAIYATDEWYPTEPYTYRCTSGLNGDEHVLYLSVQCFPVRYNPAESIITYAKSVDFSITYTLPESPRVFEDEYDLLIIAPAEFEEAVQPLISHKNSVGMNTTFSTVEEILESETSGYDDAENIKLFIKDTVENMGVTYVLLIGGMKGQKFEWYTPVRYSNNHAGVPYESGYLSDLYFADLYKNNGSEFEDWDSNDNNIFGEFDQLNKDVIDGAPDVYVGRLACRSIKEVEVVVDKIITYESTSVDDSWYKTMLCIGGDTYPGSVAGAYEAEIDTNISASYMEDFTIKRIWASTGALTGQSDVVTAWNEGAGLVHMAGHANPCILVTFPPEDAQKEQKITIMRMYSIPPLDAFYALFYQDKTLQEALKVLFSPVNPRLRNGDKQPVVVVGGCHNSQFNTSLRNILTQGFGHAYGYGVYVPKCWSWWLTSKENGGAIATMGNSGLGMGINGFNYPDGLDGWLLPRFFYNYGQLGAQYVGQAHSAAITDYVNEFDINTKDTNSPGSADRQMIEQWVLLGDPSLVMGGYS